MGATRSSCNTDVYECMYMCACVDRNRLFLTKKVGVSEDEKEERQRRVGGGTYLQNVPPQSSTPVIPPRPFPLPQRP